MIKAPSDNDGADKTDWGKIISQLLFHTSMSYESILERTIPQIEAIMSNFQENVSLKIGMPGLLGGAVRVDGEQINSGGKHPKLSDFMAFASEFD